MCKNLLKLQAALGLCVGVGSFSDPWSIQGVAHFLEHMLFMGSEKYPRENDFSSFINVSICCYITYLLILILSNVVVPTCM
jgi:predicted Zn-dependent peptidase